MRVLMFGWEFPPHITGGLGTACFGLTKGLAKQGVEVLFVVPKAYGDENQEAVRLVNASDIRIDIRQKMYQEFWKQITFLEVSSNLLPYVDPEEFERSCTEDQLEGAEERSSIFSRNFTFSGLYGQSLMSEVSRYALLTGGRLTVNDYIYRVEK